jgi:molybdate transport system ATP-binding protein
MSVDVRLRHRQGDFLLDVLFSFGAGVTALFGPSGAGKSTVINAMAGLIRPDEGRVTLDGVELFDSSRGISVPAHKRRIGVVFQDTRLFPHLSMKGNLLFGWRRVEERASGSEIERIVAMLGLEPMLDRKPHTLSGGERSRS